MAPFRLRVILLPASLLAGLGVGMGSRRALDREGPLAMNHAGGSVVGVAESASEKGQTGPFSMERFQAATGLVMHRMLAKVLPGADAGLVRALAVELSKRQPESRPAPAWEAIFARWVKLDAPAAAAWAREHKLIAYAMSAWAREDVESAISGADFENAKERETILRRLCEADPKRAIALHWEWSAKYGELEVTWGVPWIVEHSFILAQHDPAAAIAELAQHDSGAYRESQFESIALGWAAKDPAACLDWLKQLPLKERNAALGGFGDAASKAPARFAAVLSLMPMDAMIRQTCMKVARNWAEKEPAAALDWVRSRFPEGPQRADALTRVAGVLMEKDLSAAVALMDEIGWKDHAGQHVDSTRQILPGKDGTPDEIITFEDGRRFENVIGVMTNLLDRLAVVNPQEAIRVLQKTPDEFQPELAGTIALAWSSADPEAAMAWLAALPSGKTSASRLEEIVVKNLGDLEPAAIRDWALRLPPGPAQQAFAAKYATDFAQQALRAGPGALASAAGDIPFTDPASRQAALQAIVQAWGELEPVPALACLMREATPAPEICQSVLTGWTTRDAPAASTWVATLPPGPNRDGAVKGMIAALTNPPSQPDFPAALAWSLSLSDPAQRLEFAQAILKDPPRPADALELRATLSQTNALPEAERSALLGKLPP